jgi:uncharacterized membrane protein
MKNKKTNTTLIVAALCLLGFCAIAVIFNVYSLGELPASFIGAALGAVITGVVTVVLLEGQSRTEEIKERNVKVFEQKSIVFQKYINQAWAVWRDRKVSAYEYEKLIEAFYSKLMILLQAESVDKIRRSLENIGDCIDIVTGESYLNLRNNIIEIINTLSGEINFGGKINPDEVQKLDNKMFPIVFKKELIKQLNAKLAIPEFGLSTYRINPRAYSHGDEYLLFDFKNFPKGKCKIAIGPLNNKNMPLKIGLDISRDYHQFDQYRNPVKKYSYWITTKTAETGTELILNNRLPKNEETEEIEKDSKLDKIQVFSFSDMQTLKDLQAVYRSVAERIADRAAYYMTAKTVNNEYSIVELVEQGNEKKTSAVE